MTALRQYALRNRTILQLILLAALVVGTGLVVMNATAEGTPDEKEPVWLLTDAALACTSLGQLCGSDPNGYTVCREECVINVSTGEETGTGRMECFPF